MVWGRRNQLRALQELALGLSGEASVEEALATLDEADALWRSTRRPPHGSYADIVHLRAFVLSHAGRWTESEAAAARRSLDARGWARSTPTRGGDCQLPRAPGQRPTLRTGSTRRCPGRGGVDDACRHVLAHQARAAQPLGHPRRGGPRGGLRAALDLVAGSVAPPGRSDRRSDVAHELVDLELLQHNGRWNKAVAVQHLAVTELRVLAASRGQRGRRQPHPGVGQPGAHAPGVREVRGAVGPGEEALALREQLAAVSTAASGPDLSDASTARSCCTTSTATRRPCRWRAAASTCAAPSTPQNLVPTARAGPRPRHVRQDAHPLQPPGRGGRGRGAPSSGSRRWRRTNRTPNAVARGSLDTLAGALACGGEEAEAFGTSHDATGRARSSYAAHGAGVKARSRRSSSPRPVGTRPTTQNQARGWANDRGPAGRTVGRPAQGPRRRAGPRQELVGRPAAVDRWRSSQWFSDHMVM